MLTHQGYGGPWRDCQACVGPCVGEEAWGSCWRGAGLAQDQADCLEPVGGSKGRVPFRDMPLCKESALYVRRPAMSELWTMALNHPTRVRSPMALRVSSVGQGRVMFMVRVCGFQAHWVLSLFEQSVDSNKKYSIHPMLLHMPPFPPTPRTLADGLSGDVARAAFGVAAGGGPHGAATVLSPPLPVVWREILMPRASAAAIEAAARGAAGSSSTSGSSPARGRIRRRAFRRAN